MGSILRIPSRTKSPQHSLPCTNMMFRQLTYVLWQRGYITKRAQLLVHCMRIAHIATPDLPFTRYYGGTESIVCNLAEKQSFEGHEVTIIASHPANGEPLRTVSLVKPTPRSSNWFLSWVLQRFNGTIHVIKAFNWLDSKFDIIHNHLSEEGIALSFLRKAPSLNSLHGSAYSSFQKYSITRLYSITRNTKFVSLSKSSYLGYKRLYGDDLIGYVYSGVDTNLFRFVPRVEKDHEIEMCFLGRIAPDKAPEKVIFIADELHNQGIDVHLKIVGKFDPRKTNYFQKIIRLIDERDYVSRFINRRSQEVQYLAGNSDVLVCPLSNTEPFPLAPLETMACGTPIIALRQTVAKEYIINSVNGFLCNDFSEMGDSIRRFKEIDRKACRRIIERRFSVDSMYKGYMEKYQKVINGS